MEGYGQIRLIKKLSDWVVGWLVPDKNKDWQSKSTDKLDDS